MKIASLIKRLEQAGFTERRGKGSHTLYYRGAVRVMLPTNHPGKDASDGLVGNVERALRRTK